MNKMILTAAAAVALMATTLASDAGPVKGQVVAGGCNGCGTAPTASGVVPCGATAPACGCDACARDKRFGLNPLFKRLMFWKKDTACGTCNLRGRLGNCAGVVPGAFEPYPNGVPGTLVFPNHPYVRSPRDWFEK